MKKLGPILRLIKQHKIIFILLTLAIIGLIIFSQTRTKPQPLQVAAVKRQDIKSVISSSGTLTGKNTANLKFKSSGKLSYINVKAGDIVTAGQAIAGLDIQQLNIELQQAQNTLRDKQAIIDKTLDDVKNHEKDETFTQRQTRTTAEVARDNAYDSVKAAQRAFQDAVIISPIGGLVTQAPAVVGQTISSSDLIAQVVDTTEVHFDTDVDEADISKVSVGQLAQVTLDAYGDKIFEGEVSEIVPQTKTTSSGATVITVKIKLSSPPKTFVNGLTGQASIIISEAKNTLTLPQETIRDDNTVIIQDTKGLRPKKIKTGIKSDTDVEIKQGLEEGEKVILNPPGGR